MFFLLPQQFLPDPPYLPIYPTACSFSFSRKKKDKQQQEEDKKYHWNKTKTKGAKTTWSPFCVDLGTRPTPTCHSI